MPAEQRRKFSRIRFHESARLLVGAAEYPCEVRDLSLKGALIAVELPTPLPPGEPCLLELRLEADAAVRMEGTIAHAEPPHLGLVCRNIDLDSIIHLRRLIELNLGDAQLLDREFSALISD